MESEIRQWVCGLCDVSWSGCEGSCCWVCGGRSDGLARDFWGMYLQASGTWVADQVS